MAGDAGATEATWGEERLSPVKQGALLALLEQPTVAEAAKSAGVHRATLFKWMNQDPDFRAAYRRARREVFAATVSRLQQVSVEAVETLREVMLDKKQQGASRVGAAKAVIDYAVKLHETEELEERLEALEAGPEEAA